MELALGSLAEVETQLEIGAALSRSTKCTDVEQRIVRTRRMLYRLLSALR
jgi:four helix bundle protein